MSTELLAATLPPSWQALLGTEHYREPKEKDGERRVSLSLPVVLVRVSLLQRDTKATLKRKTFSWG